MTRHQAQYPELTRALQSGRSDIVGDALLHPVESLAALLLLPISNRLVARAEREKVTLSPMERTRLSGHRVVPLKTTYPAAARLLLNPISMYPLHLVQKAARRSPRALVLYAEAKPLG